MKSLDVNSILRRCKNALKRTGSAESVLTKEAIDALDVFVGQAGDTELAATVRECLYCATMMPVDMTGFSKALRRYIKLSGCHKTPKWYHNATATLRNEKLTFLDDELLRNVDITLSKQTTARQVRRIVEKRVCQSYYRLHKNTEGVTDNSHRSRMRKAVSFQLSSLGSIEDIEGFRRDKSTHWRRGYDPVMRKVVYRPKRVYDTIDEAQLAAEASFIRHPDEGKMHVYRCEHCGKYHVGHSKIEEISIEPQSALQALPMMPVVKAS